MPHPLYELLAELDSAKLYYTIGRYRPDTVLVTVSVVGERVEIDVFDDGHMEVSRFRGNENIEGDMELALQIIAKNRG